MLHQSIFQAVIHYFPIWDWSPTFQYLFLTLWFAIQKYDLLGSTENSWVICFLVSLLFPFFSNSFHLITETFLSSALWADSFLVYLFLLFSFSLFTQNIWALLKILLKTSVSWECLTYYKWHAYWLAQTFYWLIEWLIDWFTCFNNTFYVIFQSCLETTRINQKARCTDSLKTDLHP